MKIKDIYHHYTQLIPTPKDSVTSYEYLLSNKKELRYWSPNDFLGYLHMLIQAGKGDNTLTQLTFQENQNLGIIIEGFFSRKPTMEIFQRHILPKSIQTKDIEYPYSELQKYCYADLSMKFADAQERLPIILGSITDIHSLSPEELRRKRKIGFDILFTCYMRNPGFMNDMEKDFGLLQKFDQERKKEIIEGRVGEWGSIHHVLYSMSVGSHEGFEPEYFSKTGRYSYMGYLKTILNFY